LKREWTVGQQGGIFYLQQSLVLKTAAENKNVQGFADHKGRYWCRFGNSGYFLEGADSRWELR
jgi:hypothetical protein